MSYDETERKPIDLESDSFSTLVAQLLDLFSINSMPHLNDILFNSTKRPVLFSAQRAVHKVSDAKDIDRVAVEKFD